MFEAIVLVLGVGGNVSQGIVKALRSCANKVTIIGACISEDSAGLYMCDMAYISPFANDARFIPWLFNVCKKEKVNMIFTGVEEIIDAIQPSADQLYRQTGSIFVASDIKQLQITRDKLLTCEWLKLNNLHYPGFCDLSNSCEVLSLTRKYGFPLIAKPRNGKGSQGIVIVYNQEDLDNIKNFENYVLQQYIGNKTDEYTVACYCDKTGKFINLIILYRELFQGTTFKAEVVENKVIFEEAKKICEMFVPKGPLNIQLRLDSNENPVCFELNARFSGTTPIRANFGFNDVEAGIKEYVYKEDISNFFNITYGTAYRYWNEIYVDKQIQNKLIIK